MKPWPTNPPRNVHIAPFGHISVSAAQPAAFFLHKVASPFLWTRDDLRHLRAGKCLNRHPGRVGWNCDANRFLFNASATHHPRRGVLGVLAPSGRHVPGALAGWAQKVAKIPRGTYHETVVFQATEHQGLQRSAPWFCPGAGPWHQPVRTLGVAAVMLCTMQTALALRILLHMH